MLPFLEWTNSTSLCLIWFPAEYFLEFQYRCHWCFHTKPPGFSFTCGCICSVSTFRRRCVTVMSFPRHIFSFCIAGLYRMCEGNGIERHILELRNISSYVAKSCTNVLKRWNIASFEGVGTPNDVSGMLIFFINRSLAEVCAIELLCYICFLPSNLMLLCFTFLMS
jgi:hypothetical protein